MQLSELGTVLDRQLSIVDLEQALRQQQARILRLKLFIARATEQLKSELPADVRLRLQLQLQEARANLDRATRAHKADARRGGASPGSSLTLTTQQSASARRSRAGAAASSAPPAMPARSSPTRVR